MCQPRKAAEQLLGCFSRSYSHFFTLAPEADPDCDAGGPTSGLLGFTPLGLFAFLGRFFCLLEGFCALRVDMFVPVKLPLPVFWIAVEVLSASLSHAVHWTAWRKKSGVASGVAICVAHFVYKYD